MYEMIPALSRDSMYECFQSDKPQPTKDILDAMNLHRKGVGTRNPTYGFCNYD
jgi:hypothetical protein